MKSKDPLSPSESIIEEVLLSKFPTYKFFRGTPKILKLKYKTDDTQYDPFLFHNRVLGLGVLVIPDGQEDEFDRLVELCEMTDLIVISVPYWMMRDDGVLKEYMERMISVSVFDNVRHLERRNVKDARDTPHKVCVTCKTIYLERFDSCWCGGNLVACSTGKCFHDLKFFGDCPDCSSGNIVKRENSKSKKLFFGCSRFKDANCRYSEPYTTYMYDPSVLVKSRNLFFKELESVPETEPVPRDTQHIQKVKLPKRNKDEIYSYGDPRIREGVAKRITSNICSLYRDVSYEGICGIFSQFPPEIAEFLAEELPKLIEDYKETSNRELDDDITQTNNSPVTKYRNISIPDKSSPKGISKYSNIVIPENYSQSKVIPKSSQNSDYSSSLDSSDEDYVEKEKKERPKPVLINPPDPGYCIHCREEIEFNILKPLCDICEAEGATFFKYCHKTSEFWMGSTLENPVMD